MKPCSLKFVVSLIGVALLGTVAWQPARAADAPTVGIGDALFGCTRVATYGRQDDERLNAAKIHVEDIKGPILLVSGASDDKWPSTTMANLIVERLQSHDFPYFYAHLTVKGGHDAAEQHFDAVRHFLGKYFKPGTASGCANK